MADDMILPGAQPIGSEPAPPTPADTPPTPWMPTDAEIESQVVSQAKVSFQAAKALDPQQEAKARARSIRTGIPISVARNTPDEETPAFKHLASLAPATVAWFTDPSRAAIAKDSVDSLSRIELIRAYQKEANAAVERDIATPVVGPVDSFNRGYQQTAEANRMRGLALLSDDEALNVQADAIDADFKDFETRMSKGSGLRKWMNAGAEMGGLFANMGLRAAPRAAAIGTGAALTAVAVGQMGPQIAIPEEILTAPGAFMAAARVATSASITTDMFLIESGAAAQELRAVRDMNGEPLDPTVVKMAAVSVGLVNAALEQTGAKAIAAMFKTPGGKATLGAVLADKTLIAAAKTIAAKYGKGVATETATEMAQEFSTVLANALAIRLTNAPFGQDQGSIDGGRILDAGGQALLGSSFLGLAPTVVHAGREVTRVRQAAAFLDVQDKLHAEVQASPMTQRDPAAAEQFLQSAGLGGYADMSASALEKVPGDVLAKIGLTSELVAEASASGLPLRVRLETLHANLDEAEWTAVRSSISEVGGIPAGEAETMDLEAEWQRGAQASEARIAAEDSRRQEVQRLRGEVQSAVMSTPRLREQTRSVGSDPRDFVDEQMALIENQALALQGVSGGKLSAAEFLKKVTVRADPKATPSRVEEILPSEASKVSAAVANGAVLTVDGKPVTLEGTKLNGVELAALPEGTKVTAAYPAQGALAVTDGKFLIKLFANADLSTLAHEGSHAFFTDAMALMRAGTVTDGFKKDWASLVEWLGVDPSAEGITPERMMKAQEQFARGWEAWLREGKAPTEASKGMMRRFGDWLSRIYKTVAALGADYVPLTDDVRGVFGRVIEAGEAVESAATAVYATELTDAEANGLGLDAKERAALDARVAGLRKTATATLLEQRNRGREERRKAWREQATAEIAETPVYVAMRNVIDAGGLNRAAVGGTYPAEVVAALDEKRLLKTDATATAEDIAGKMLGAMSPQEVVAGLVSAKSSIGAAVTDRVNALEAEYDAKHTADAAMASSMASYIEDLRKAASENAEETAKTDRSRNRIEGAAILTLAKGMISRMTMREAGNVFRFQNAMRAAMRRSRTAAAKGKKADALAALDQALLNLYLSQEAQSVRDFAGRFERAVPSVTRAKRGSIEGDRHMAAFKVLAMLNLVTSDRYLREAAGRNPAKLVDILTANEEDPSLDGSELFVDARARVDAWTPGQKPVALGDMRVGAAMDMADLLDYLIGTGRDLVHDDARSLGGTRTEIIAEVTSDSIKRLKYTPAEPGTARRKAQDYKLQYHADGANLASIFSRMDGDVNPGGGGVAGPNEKRLYLSLERASEHKQKISSAVTKLAKEHINILKKLQDSLPSKRFAGVPVPQLLRDNGVSVWTFEQVLSLALNHGNADNIARVKAGYPDMTDDHILQLLSVFKDEHWDAIAGVADAVQSMWPESVKVFERINHYRPAKINGTPFTTPSGKRMSGWYWPVRYDAKLDAATALAEEKDAFFGASGAMFGKPKAGDGSLQSRGEVTNKPILLSMQTFVRHVDFTATYTAYAEVLRDVDAVTNSPEYQRMVTETAGKAYAESIRPSLKNLARKPNQKLSVISRILENSRAPATAYMLVCSVTNSLQNLASIFPAVKEHGMTYFSGFLEFAMHPINTFHAVNAISATMRERTGFIDADISTHRGDFTEKRVKGVPFLNGIALSDVRKFSYVMQFVSDTLVTYPIWLGVYKKDLAETRSLDGEGSIAKANAAVAKLQGSSRDLDASSYNREKGGISRVFTMFYTFWGQYGRRLGGTISGVRAGNLPVTALGSFAIMEIMLPVVLGSAIAYYMSDDERRKKMDKMPMWQRVLSATGSYAVGGLPMVRDILAAAFAFSGAPKSTIGNSPIYVGLNLVKDSLSSFKELAVELDGPHAARAVYRMADLLSAYHGIPAAKIAASMFEDLEALRKPAK